MNKDPEFIERVRVAIDKVGGQAAMAEATGLSKSVISKYVNGHSEPDRQRLMAIAKAANTYFGWLAAGEGDEKAPEPDTYHIKFYENTIVPNHRGEDIPIQKRLCVRMTPYPVSSYFLHKVLGADTPDDLGAFIVHGDCMEPTLYSGDVVIVDLTEIDLVDGIHLIVDRGGIHYRRLHIPLGGEVELRYDNANMYHDNIKIPDESLPQLEIVGRVIWHGRRI